MQGLLIFLIRTITLMTGVLFIFSALSYASSNDDERSKTALYRAYITEFTASFNATQSNVSKKKSSTPSKKQILKATENLGRRLAIIVHKQVNLVSQSELKLFQKEVLNIFIQLSLYLQTISDIQRSNVERLFFRITYASKFSAMGGVVVGANYIFDSWWLASVAGVLSVVPLRVLSDELQGPWYDLENDRFVPKAQKRVRNKLMRTFIAGAEQEGLDLSAIIDAKHPSIALYSVEFLQSVYQLIKQNKSDPCLKLLVDPLFSP